MVIIIFESHAISFDNEKKMASGHFDVALSPLGEKQAKELGKRWSRERFDAIFCSDLQRSYKTAELAFGKKYPIYKDYRLRECDYGDYEHKAFTEIESVRTKYINKPFPNGESYSQRATLMKSFMHKLAENYQGKKIMIIGHRATQYGIERWATGKSLREIVATPWQWQPFWKYTYGKSYEDR